MLIVVGAASLMDFLIVAVGTLGFVIAVATLLVRAALATMAVARKCPPNDLLGVDVYEGAAATEAKSAGKPHA